MFAAAQYLMLIRYMVWIYIHGNACGDLDGLCICDTAALTAHCQPLCSDRTRKHGKALKFIIIGTIAG